MAEPTFQDALKAMKVAQEKGDMEAAKKMARLAKTLEGQSSRNRIDNNSPIGQFNKSVAGALNVLRAPAAFADMGVNAAGRAITGENVIPEPRSTEEVFRGMDIAVADQRPETVMQGLGRGAGDAAAMYAPVVGALNLVRGSISNPAVVSAIDDALRGLGGVSGLMAEVTAGAGAGAAGRGAEQAGYPELAPIAEIAGGVGTGLAAVGTGATGRAGVRMAGETPLAGTAMRVGRDIKRAIVPMTEGGAREVARSRLHDLAGGEERAAELGGMIDPRDEFGRTGARQTEDPNLIGLERSAATENPNIRERLDARAAGVEGRVSTAATDMGGDVTDARDYFRTLVDDAISGANQEVSAAGPARTKAENSVAVVNRLKGALDDAVAEERSKWAAVPKGATVETANAKEIAASLIAETPRAQQSDIPAVLRNLLVDENGFGDQETVAEMHGLYSELRRVARSAMAGNDQNKNKARIANAVADAIMEDLGAVDPQNPIGRAINDARTFSRELHETFDRGAVGRILKRTLDGDEAMASEASLDRTVGRGGAAAGADNDGIRAAANMAGENVQDYLRSRFSEAIFNASGEFNPKQARTWLRNNVETVNRYPGLKAQLIRALQNREAAEVFSMRADIKDFNSGQAGDAVKAIIRADNPVQAARSLAATARQDGSGKALAGIKGSFSDYLTQDTGKLPALLSDPKLRASMSQVFDQGEMRRWQKIASAMKSMDAPSRDVGDVVDSPANQIVEWVVRTVAARQGGQMGGGSMGGSLQTANIAVNKSMTALRNLTNQRARELLMQAVEDPALMRELLMQPEAWARGVGKTSKSRLAPYLTGTAAQMGENEQ